MGMLVAGHVAAVGALVKPTRFGPTSRPSLLSEALQKVQRSTSLLEAMRAAPAVVRAVEEARGAGTPVTLLIGPLLEAIEDEADSLTAIAAIHALARIPGSQVDTYLASLVDAGVEGLAGHGVWAMQSRAASIDHLAVLARTVAQGGLAGMQAQRVLSLWASREPACVLGALRQLLLDLPPGRGRRYIVETIGLVPGRPARKSLALIATDADEDVAVRRAAIAAFVARIHERMPAGMAELGCGDDAVGEMVRAVRVERRLARRGPLRQPISASGGIRVAQIHLGAVLDPAVSEAGMGDTGGVATLLSRLGVALAHRPHISDVLTIGRSADGDPATTDRAQQGHHFESVSLEKGEGGSFQGAWPSMLEVTRGIGRALLAAPLPHVMHLRMADPGSLAAAWLAQRLGIATVFTFAPDPHGPIAAAEAAGELDRRSFARADARDHLWFRARLVERLARQADQVVLFPRRDMRERLRDLVGIDVTAGEPRFTVVAEGIEQTLIERARVVVERPSAARRQPILRALRTAIGSLPQERHGLPIVVSVGRMHELKGMARIVEGFAHDAVLAQRANLVIVGGDLADPSAHEAAELSRIKRLFDACPGLSDRVVLMGHRPNSQIGFVLGAARAGLGTLIGSDGAYVCGSRKEEFGLAIVEAMAAGLPVVVPRTGGPATYVEPGVTGVVVDTLDAGAIARGTIAALDLARLPQTAAHTRAVVESRYTIEQMARTLTAVYRGAVGASGLGLAATTKSPS